MTLPSESVIQHTSADVAPELYDRSEEVADE